MNGHAEAEQADEEFVSVSVCGQETTVELFKEYSFILNKIDEHLDTFGYIWDTFGI